MIDFSILKSLSRGLCQDIVIFVCQSYNIPSANSAPKDYWAPNYQPDPKSILDNYYTRLKRITPDFWAGTRRPIQRTRKSLSITEYGADQLEENLYRCICYPYWENCAVVQLYLDQGANINFTKDGMSLLGAAGYWGKKDIVQLLLDKGANIHAQGLWECTWRGGIQGSEY